MKPVQSGPRATTALERVRLLVLDVDGVMTDGRLYFNADGEALKAFHVHDGLGLKLAMRAGIEILVLSGRRSEAVSARCRELGVRCVEQGCEDKVAALDRWLTQLGLSRADALCVVDDSSDVPLMRAVGVAIAVADAHREAIAAAHRVTSIQGGRGAVREVCDWLVAAREARQ